MAAAKKPDEIAQEAASSGQAKARTSWDKTLVASFLAGAYISFGALVAITVSSGLDPEIWGTLPTLFTGLAFTLGLVLVLIAGSSLLTGNMLLVPLSAMDRRISLPEVARNLGSSCSATSSGRCSWRTSSPSRPASSAAPEPSRGRRRR
jgi:formate/nitrite transporter FocA (FNT family)